MVEVLSWRMVKFTGLRGPAYVDLGQVAAIIESREPRPPDAPPVLDVVKGATVYLSGGEKFYVKESADAVFEEVHRFRTMPEPAPPTFKTPGAAP